MAFLCSTRLFYAVLCFFCNILGKKYLELIFFVTPNYEIKRIIRRLISFNQFRFFLNFYAFFVYHLGMELFCIYIFLLQVKTPFFHLDQNKIQLKSIVFCFFCIRNIFLIPEGIESAKIVLEP